MQGQLDRPRWFRRLAIITASLVWILIVIGAIVRVSDSGLGCGNDWPLCNGSIVPPLDDINAWIEWSHRLVAISIGIFGIGMLITVLRSHRSNKLAVGATILAALLYAFQSDLGRNVVKADLSPTLVLFHLGMAMLLLAALILAAVFVSYQPQTRYKPDSVTALAYITTVLAFVIILLGGLVRGSGADLACVDWPLCNGEVFPFDQGQLATIHMIHRYAVVALGISLLLLVWQIWQNRQDQRLRRVAVFTLVAFLIQAGIGAMFILSAAAPIWGAAHVGMAGATWGLLVIFCAIEWLNSHASSALAVENSWKAQSEPTP